jgi:soluble lytic murein transglycosylase-like protein
MRWFCSSAPGVLAALGLVFWSVPEAVAEIYQFVDEDGVVHFTNVPSGDSRFKAVDAPPRTKPRERSQPAGKGTGRAVSREDNRPLSVAARVRKRPASAEPDAYDGFIREASERFHLHEALIRAVMAVESNFNPDAISHAGAEGLMQLMPATARLMGVDDSFNPRQNILGGARYLRHLANTFAGDMVLTLAAYNAGQRRVERHGDIPPIRETQLYVRRVLQLYFHYKKTYGPPAEEPEP